MKKFLVLATMLLSAVSWAQVSNIPLTREQLGSGTPAQNVTVGLENAALVMDGMFHAPQYLPGFPTAATIWPRTVEVDCEKDKVGHVSCKGYHWTPDLGRGEYLFVIPKLKEQNPPNIVIVPGPERLVIVEGPPKKIRQ